MGSVTEQLSLTFILEQFPCESCTRLMAIGLAMLQILLLAPGTKQRKGKSEQRPEAQEWAETVGDMWPGGSSDTENSCPAQC